jgi:hypothetical protein
MTRTVHPILTESKSILKPVFTRIRLRPTQSWEMISVPLHPSGKLTITHNFPVELETKECRRQGQSHQTKRTTIFLANFTIRIFSFNATKSHIRTRPTAFNRHHFRLSGYMKPFSYK